MREPSVSDIGSCSPRGREEVKEKNNKQHWDRIMLFFCGVKVTSHVGTGSRLVER